MSVVHRVLHLGDKTGISAKCVQKVVSPCSTRGQPVESTFLEKPTTRSARSKAKQQRNNATVLHACLLDHIEASTTYPPIVLFQARRSRKRTTVLKYKVEKRIQPCIGYADRNWSNPPAPSSLLEIHRSLASDSLNHQPADGRNPRHRYIPHKWRTPDCGSTSTTQLLGARRRFIW